MAHAIYVIHEGRARVKGVVIAACGPNSAGVPQADRLAAHAIARGVRKSHAVPGGAAPVAIAVRAR